MTQALWLYLVIATIAALLTAMAWRWHQKKVVVATIVPVFMCVAWLAFSFVMNGYIDPFWPFVLPQVFVVALFGSFVGLTFCRR
jgi:hypothetical protein